MDLLVAEKARWKGLLFLVIIVIVKVVIGIKASVVVVVGIVTEVAINAVIVVIIGEVAVTVTDVVVTTYLSLLLLLQEQLETFLLQHGVVFHHLLNEFPDLFELGFLILEKSRGRALLSQVAHRFDELSLQSVLAEHFSDCNEYA